eukprot:2438708-Amphidinium_carterae.1
MSFSLSFCLSARSTSLMSSRFHPATSEDIEVDAEDVCKAELEVDDIVLLGLLLLSEVDEVDVYDALTLPPGSEIIRVDVDGGIVLPCTSEDIE